MILVPGGSGGGGREGGSLPEMRWNDIDAAGCYLLMALGDLIRLPEEAIDAGRRPIVRATSNQGVWVARLSEDPEAPLSVARAVATANGYFVDF
ncbi:MAG: hypothetical protein ABIH26_06505 [Candidatus Eisenbacteria bacterium]